MWDDMEYGGGIWHWVTGNWEGGGGGGGVGRMALVGIFRILVGDGDGR